MTFVTLDLSVTESHVSEMVDRFDAGLCDPGTSNAVCLALRERVELSAHFRVSFHRGRLRAELDREWIDLPEELANWLQRAMEGWAVAPRTFRLQLPRHWIESPAVPLTVSKQASSRMAA